MTPVPRRRLTTDRLVLRPSSALDVDRAFEIRSDWEVTRMLSRASFPPDREHMKLWFAGHEREWRDGTAYRFAIEREGPMIGLIDVDIVADGKGTLGYWLDRPFWGQGYGFEAAEAVVRFAFGELGLSRLTAGHAQDNEASGRILVKLGFRPIEVVDFYSKSRDQTIRQHRYVLVPPQA